MWNRTTELKLNMKGLRKLLYCSFVVLRGKEDQT